MPKIIGDTLSDHRELTRQKLFEALGELMAESSFDSLTISEIASRAGVGRTAVYNHFADKEVLLLAFIHNATSQFAQILTRSMAGQDDPVEQMRIYLRAHMEMTDKYHLTSGVSLRQQVSEQNSDHLHAHADVGGDLLRGILEKAMARGRIPRQDQGILIALINSSLAGVRLPEPGPAREEAVATIQGYVLRGIGVSCEEAPVLARTGASEGDTGRASAAHRSSDSFMRCPVTH